MVQIIPAILPTSEENFQRDISKLNNSQSCKEGWVHIDFMDNIFVPNKSISPLETAKYPIYLSKEAHLMVKKPLEWVEGISDSGFKRVLVHIESDGIKESLKVFKDKGLEIGLAIKNETDLNDLQPFLDKVDIILVMGVEPGFQGQEFIPNAINKIEKLCFLRKEGKYNFKIAVDGSIRDDNIQAVVDAGADFVVVGSFLLKGDIDENLESLWEALS